MMTSLRHGAACPLIASFVCAKCLQTHFCLPGLFYTGRSQKQSCLCSVKVMKQSPVTWLRPAHSYCKFCCTEVGLARKSFYWWRRWRWYDEHLYHVMQSPTTIQQTVQSHLKCHIFNDLERNWFQCTLVLLDKKKVSFLLHKDWQRSLSIT